MAGISVSISRGVEGFKFIDFTIGTSTPGVGDIELRFNTLDTNSVNLTRKDVINALEAFRRVLEQGGLQTTTPIL